MPDPPTEDCKFCGDRIVFKGEENGRRVPYNLDGKPHFPTCMGQKAPEKKETPQPSIEEFKTHEVPPKEEKRAKKKPEMKEQPPAPDALAKKQDFVAMDVADWENNMGIPRGFIVMMGERGKEKPFVMRAGLLVKADKKGYRSIQVEVTPIKDGFEAKATLYPSLYPADYEILKHLPADPKLAEKIVDAIVTPITEYGTATKDNVKNQQMWPYMKEMACTRASNRALRVFTACGLTSVEELSDAVIQVEERK